MSLNGDDLKRCVVKVEEVIVILEGLLARTHCKFVREVLPGQISTLKSVAYAEGKLMGIVNDDRKDSSANGKD